MSSIASRKSKKQKKVSIREQQSVHRRRIAAVALILFCIYGAYAFYAVNPTVIDKVVGKYAINYLFGRGTLFVMFYGVICGVMLFMNTLKPYSRIVLLVALILFEMLTIMSVTIPNLENGIIKDFFGTVYLGGYGGVFGMLFAFLLKTIFRSTGLVAFLLVVLILVEVFFIYREIFPKSFSRFKEKRYGLDWAQQMAEKVKQEKEILEKRREKREEREASENFSDEDDGLFFSGVDEVEVDTKFLNTEDVMDQLDPEATPRERMGRKKGKRLGKNDSEIRNGEAKKDTEVKVATEMMNLDDIQIENVSGDYHFPDTALLNPMVKKGGNKQSEVNTNRAIIERTLKNFGVNAKVLGAERGPSITRFELQPDPGTKVSKIVGLSDDLALALATSDIRIEAPIPGKAAVGIEVPNKESEIVSMREIAESNAFKRTKATLPIALGKTLSGQNIIGDIAKMPHLLIAGATGSGKSVCINTIILSLLYKKTPDELRFIMIDPKMVELNQYNALPHQLIPVVTDPKKAAYALNWGIKEMTNRYELFKTAGVRDIDGYNARQAAAGEEKLPRIVIVIDELADLMMTSPKEVEAAICRIAQLARACGIHLVIATQRPSVDVITGLIKANIPSRIAFAVSSNTDSRTILDMAGAEKLLGKGDMLYFPMGKSKPLRVQCTFVADDEINRVIDAVAGEQKMTFDPQIEKVIEEFEERAANPPEDDRDDALLPRAIDVAFTYNQVSTSMLQRRLKVGYARAGRLVDELEKAGIISGPNGSKPRTLLMTRQEYYDLHPEKHHDGE